MRWPIVLAVLCIGCVPQEVQRAEAKSSAMTNHQKAAFAQCRSVLEAVHCDGSDDTAERVALETAFPGRGEETYKKRCVQRLKWEYARAPSKSWLARMGCGKRPSKKKMKAELKRAKKKQAKREAKARKEQAARAEEEANRAPRTIAGEDGE